MKVGDRIIVNGMHDGVKFVNEPGRIIGFATANGDVCIEFDNYSGVYDWMLGHAGSKSGYCWFVSPEMIREDSMKDKIEALEKELAELKALLKYAPTPGNYIVQGSRTVFDLADGYLDDGAYTKNGRAFDTRDKAEKASDIMVKHDIILKYVIDHAPNYEPNEYDCASIFFCRDSGKWKRVLASDTGECVGTILMPIKIADKLADDLNNDRIDFN